MRHLFNIHAAFGRGDEGDAAGLPVDQQGKVQLARNVGAVFDIDTVHLLAGGAGLAGDKGTAQHLLGHRLGLFHRTGQAHAALFAGLSLFEGALAAAACMDLGLDHPERAIQPAGCGLCLFRLQNHAPVGNGDPETAQKRLGLILVDVHGTVPSAAGCRPDATEPPAIKTPTDGTALTVPEICVL